MFEKQGYHLICLAVLLFMPSAYLLFSVVRYFGFPRALGIDHFDESYRTKPQGVEKARVMGEELAYEGVHRKKKISRSTINQSFDVLSGCDHQTFDDHFLQSS
jgi:hypothetical protein